MRRSIPAALGSMMLGAVLTLPFADLVHAAAGALRVQSDSSQLRRIDRSLLDAQGPIDVVVQLAGEPLAVANGPDARHGGGRLNRGQQIAYSQKLRRDQDSVLARVLALGGKEIGRVQIAYNAALVRIDASKAGTLANLPGVRSVQRASDFHINLTETVPYVGAAAVHAAGVTGKGVRVAVLDSGVDYTHRNLGGPGTVAAYQKALASATSRSGVFDPSPTAKVYEGYDFVGEHWDGDKVRTLEPDDNPIDADGHGTHVADIIGGKSKDGTHVGVAPDVSLLAVKVCSAVSTACSGFAILEGIDYALDPNGDKSMDDAVDIINLSVSASYGQKEDSTAVAASNAAKAGVIVVTVAGNSGDKPYDLGSPGISPDVITVAQTQVPSATAIPLVIKSPANIANTYLNTAVLSFARVTTGVQAPVVYLGTGCPNETYPVSPGGRIALIDRGGTDCNISAKIARAGAEGAVGVIIAMVDDSAPLSFSNGGECPPPGGACVPSVVIDKDTADAIRANLSAGVVAEISPKNGIALTGSMASTSARGPSYDYNQLKPDLAAPGASVSARAGTGSGEEAFSGTSGSAPMVAGAAALMLEAYPTRSPWEIKSALMNTADPEVYTDPVFLPGVLAPITRVGAGELQVNKAIATTTAAWDAARRTGSLSFGYRNVSDNNETLARTVRVQNYSRSPRRYDVSNIFRYSNDAASGAVKILTPGSIIVPPFSSTTFDVVMRIDASRLPVWGFFGGAKAGNGPLLQSVEYDGFITLKDSRDTVRLPWHVLPHRSSEVRAVNRNVVIPNKGFGLLALANSSRSLPGIVDVFNLTGTSPRLRPWQLPDEEDETTVHDLAAVGVRATVDNVGLPIVQFAIHTYGRRAHPAYPGGFNVFVDSNNDGKPDFRLFNAEWHGFDSDGVTVIAVDDLSTDADNGNIPVYYYIDADLDSSNIIMSVPPQAIGVKPGVPIRFDVEARDNYFAEADTDGLTDAIRGMVFTLDRPRYTVLTDGSAQTGVPARGGLILKVNDVPGGDRASPSQTGFLMMYRDAAEEAETVSVYRTRR
jgi:subtilisin family serine protease